MSRILCLHGMGCNAKILKWQLTPFIRALGSQAEFVFIDGEVECDAAPGLEGIAPPPFLCFYSSVATSEIALAHEQIEQVLEDEGPFDGVLGFSQGSALAASVLLNHALKKPFERPPFNFAIFFSGNLAFSPDHGLYLELIDKFFAEHKSATDGKGSFLSTLLEADPHLRELAFSSLSDTENGRSTLAALNADPRSEESCRAFLPDWTKANIKIPTLHVVGKTDLFAPQAKVVYELCSSKERILLEHPGAHDVPREEPYLGTAIKSARQVMERSKLFAGGAFN